MSNQFKPLNQLTKDEIQELINACISFDAGNILGSGYKESEVSFYSAPKFGWEWKTKKEFENEITKTITNTDSIAAANKVLERQLAKVPEQPAAAIPADLKTLVEKAKERATAQAEATKKGIEKTQAFIKQQQERAERLKEILKNKEVHAKIEAKEPEAKLTPQQTEAINKLKEELVQNPETAKEVTEQLAEEIKARIVKDTPPEILDNVAKQTAYDAVQALRGDIETSPVIQAAYFQAVAGSPAVIEKVVQDPEIAKEVTKTAADLANSKISQLELSKQIFAQAFGDDAAKAVFGERIVSISETTAPGYTQTFSLSQIPGYYSQNLSDQNSLLNDVKNLGFDEARARIGTHFGGLIEKRIASLPEGHLLKSGFVSNTLGVFGVGAPVKWVVAEGASPVIKFAVSSGYGPLLGAVQSATGWSLGISKVAGGTAAKVAAGAVVKKGLAGIVSRVVTAVGALGSWATFGLSLVASWLIGKIIEKIRWDKVKKALPYIVGLVLFPFFGPIAAVVGAVGTALLGGASLGGIGAGIGGFFLALGGATLGAIGMPILVTLLVFPVVVALILFIINSGAYIVPPGLPESPFVGAGINVVCSDEKGPVGVAGPSSSSPIANRAWEITFDLYQGFWCYWNRSPKAPPQYFPNDTLTYPPGYPELFDYEAYKRNPNSAPKSGNLFWCTLLARKAYEDNNVSIPSGDGDLVSENMFNHWPRKKILPNEATASNVVPGSVVFFKVIGPGHPDRINHVGVVYSVDPGGIIFVESNAPLKSQSLNFKPGGGVGNIGPMITKGFGLP